MQKDVYHPRATQFTVAGIQVPGVHMFWVLQANAFGVSREERVGGLWESAIADRNTQSKTFVNTPLEMSNVRVFCTD